VRTLRHRARLAPIALLPVAAFAVHQLRYALAFGWHDGAQLQATGHSYLHSVAPWLALALGLVAGAFLRAVGRAMSGQRTLPRYALSLGGLWALCSVALIALFAAQELLEGLVVTGHPAGLAGVFGYGGWWAIPAALCVGLILASLFHGARWVLDEVARHRARGPVPGGPRVAPASRPRTLTLPRLTPLADGWSGRGPPRPA
jgi:hypothetical protein